ncbi:hypothetical protein CPB83DRAFT_851905 [Crepidotus variabilis]|uniref:Inhibitor I9 domain-containing protein n=1 Tax=Crepidotus variabilis TaxID=179855 RepID=A0A9P6EJ94_9AGAR|nr:hypothetical protein CPB83DRAFT_851905 [Crepidotus variabilis]
MLDDVSTPVKEIHFDWELEDEDENNYLERVTTPNGTSRFVYIVSIQLGASATTEQILHQVGLEKSDLMSSWKYGFAGTFTSNQLSKILANPNVESVAPSHAAVQDWIL